MTLSVPLFPTWIRTLKPSSWILSDGSTLALLNQGRVDMNVAVNAAAVNTRSGFQYSLL